MIDTNLASDKMVTMSDDQITMDQLAEMVQKGFEDISGKMATKEDIKSLKLELDEVKDHMDYGFRSMNDKIDDLKVSLGEPPVSRNEHDDLAGRVKYTETRLGVVSGK